LYDWKYEQARKELDRAKELNPSSAQVYHFYGHYLQFTGRVREAVEEMKHGLALDPRNAIVSNELASAYAFARSFDEAIAQYRKTLEIDPGFLFALGNIAATYESQGRFQEALAELKKMPAQYRDDPLYLSEFASVQARLGNKTDAERILERIKQPAAGGDVDQVNVALVMLAIGNQEQCLDWLEKAYESHSPGCPWLKVDPRFDPLRSHPRFVALIAKIGS
jgi:adenylate cyclase